MEPGEITYQELIGLSAEVVESNNPDMVGIKGRVTDETHNMLVIDACGEKHVQKSVTTFIFNLPGNLKVKVDGSLLIGRPEDRIPKRRKKHG